MRAGLLALPTKGRVAVALAGLALAAAILLGGASPGSAAPSSGIVVNEVYGGGGNSGATYTNDFIELRNRGTAAVSLDRLVGAVPLGQRRPRPGRSRSSAARSRAGGHLPGRRGGGRRRHAAPAHPAGHRHDRDVGHGRHGRAGQRHDGADLQRLPPTARHRHRSTSSATARRVMHEGAPPRPARPTPTSVQRNGTAADTRRQRRRLHLRPPRPPAPPTSAVAAAAPATATRPAAHPRHPGLELARRRTTASRSPTCPASSPRSAPAGSSRGYWIQDPDPDSSPATSEGIFVFTSSPRRWRSATRCSCRAPSATSTRCRAARLRRDHVEPLGHRDRDPDGHRAARTGNALPAPVVIGPDHGARHLRARTSTAPTSSRRRSRRPARPWTTGSRVEGMRVEVDDARVVGPSNDFGEQYVTTKPTQAATYRGGTELLAENAIPSGRLEVVAGRRRQPRRRRRRRLHRRHGRARSTTRSSAAT